MPRQVSAKSVGKGNYILIDDIPCEVKKVSKSSPGKHGSAKIKIQAEGIFDGKLRTTTKPADRNFLAPEVDKRKGQVVSLSSDSAQLMDMESYDTFEIKVEEGKEVEEGEEVDYWVVGDRKLLKPE